MIMLLINSVYGTSRANPSPQQAGHTEYSTSIRYATLFCDPRESAGLNFHARAGLRALGLAAFPLDGNDLASALIPVHIFLPAHNHSASDRNRRVRSYEDSNYQRERETAQNFAAE